MPWPRSILLTAGPTHEPIDRVRYLANRSSGRMGIALTRAAVDRGIPVTLLLGPVAAEPSFEHTHITVVRFQTTDDLRTLLATHFPAHDLLIMAAAVADYIPSPLSGTKLTRSAEPLTLTLLPTPDLVGETAATRAPHQRIVGFALEDSGDLESRAAEKMRRKGLDAIIANPLETMQSEDIRNASILFADGVRMVPPESGAMTKEAFAGWAIDQLMGQLRPHEGVDAPSQ